MGKVQQNAKSRLVALGELGALVGESHPRAKLTDHDVELIHQLRAEGLSLGRIARAMEVHKSTVQKILDGSRRGCVVVIWKRVPLRPKS